MSPPAMGLLGKGRILIGLQPITTLLERAVEGRYAIGYFESWNLESTLAVLDAAEAIQSPVIIGMNGDFMLNPLRNDRFPLASAAAIMQSAAEAFAVPVGTLLNETSGYDDILRAMDLGFSGVMLRSPNEHDGGVYVKELTNLVEVAHAKGIWVEGEIGILPTSVDGTSHRMKSGILTDPKEASDFVKRTGVDALAVSVGNVHHLVDETVQVDYNRLKEIHEATQVPLVVHGGTGVAKDQFRLLAEAGMAKLNVGSSLKVAFLNGMREALANAHQAMDPHELLGTGGVLDVMTEGRLRMRDAVIEFMEALGCAGRASVDEVC